MRGFVRSFSAVTGLIVITSLLMASVGAADVVIDQRGADIDGADAGDYAGLSVAMSSDGSTVAVGSPFHDGGFLNGRGHVRVFRWNGTSWSQVGADLDGEAPGDHFGGSIALSFDGSIIAIGAYGNDGGGSDAGHVRVFVWDGNNWAQRGADIDGEAALDSSGESVALSADGAVVAIGASGHANSTGHVRVFVWDGNNWTQRGTDIDGEALGDQSGGALALSSDGDVLAIGAGLNNGSGHVRVYNWDGTNWTQRGTDIDGEAIFDFFGEAVAISADGSILAVGAAYNDGPLGIDGDSYGHVRVYGWDGSNWTQRGTDIDGEARGDLSGSSVDLSHDGSILVVGAFSNDGGGVDAGHVRMYTWDGRSWVQRGTDIDGEAANDLSGFTVAMSANGSSVAVGAPQNADAGLNAGHVRLFQIRTVTPSPIPTMTPMWRATLDPNGGVCIDSAERTEPWSSVFVGYRYLPNATDCTRDGYTFTGWASTTNPTTPVSLPTLVDPRDGQRRMFLAANADLIAIWTRNIDPISDLTVFANFLCGPCTNAWLLFTMPSDVTDYEVTVNDTITSCTQQGTLFELSLCEITSLSPGDYDITLTPTRGPSRGPTTTTTLTLRK